MKSGGEGKYLHDPRVPLSSMKNSREIHAEISPRNTAITLTVRINKRQISGVEGSWWGRKAKKKKKEKKSQPRV